MSNQIDKQAPKHVLYTVEDMKNEDPESTLYKVVVEGGLNVCKVCGEFEAGLDNPCKTNKQEVN